MCPVTEPIFVSMLEYKDHEGGRNRHGGEYFTFWYIGQVPENAVGPFAIIYPSRNLIYPYSACIPPMPSTPTSGPGQRYPHAR